MRRETWGMQVGVDGVLNKILVEFVCVSGLKTYTRRKSSFSLPGCIIYHYNTRIRSRLSLLRSLSPNIKTDFQNSRSRIKVVVKMREIFGFQSNLLSQGF